MAKGTRALLKAFGKPVRLSDVHLDGEPDYDIKFGYWRALISDRYVKRYYDRQTAESRLLKTLRPDIVLRLTINDLNRVRRERRRTIVLVLVSVLYLYLMTTDINIYGVLAAALLLLGTEQFFLWKRKHGHYAENAADLLFLVIRELERNSKYWNDINYRGNHAADLEVVAKYLERIPFEVKGVASSTRRDLLKTSRANAQAMRNLQLRAIKPQEFTSSDMAKRLTQDMCTILEGRWYDLPEEPYERQISRWSMTLQLTGAFIFIGLAIALIGFVAKLGPIAPVLATAFTAIALYILDKVGIPTGITDRYAKIGNEIIPGR